MIDTPQAVDVVSRDLFTLQSAHSLEEALLNVASVSPSVGDGQRDQVYIRGFSAQYDQYLDGVRDEAMYFRDLANIDRIEVLEGPAAVLYGHGSAGGLVNRITRQPTAVPVGSFTLSAGVWNDRRAEVDAGGPLGSGSAAYRLDLAGENSGGFRDQYFLQRFHVSPSLGWQVSPSTHLLFQFDYLTDLRIDDLGIPALVGRAGSGFPGEAPPIDIRSYYGSPDSFNNDYVRSDVGTGTFVVDHTVAPNLSLHEVFRAERAALNRNNMLPTGVFLPAGGIFTGDLSAVAVTRSQRQIRRLEKDFFNQFEAKWSSNGPTLRQTVLVGLELGRQDGGMKNAQFNAPPVALIDPVLTDVVRGTPPASRAATTVRADTAGLYLQDQLDIFKHWKIVLGTRLDYYQVTQHSLFRVFNVIGSVNRSVSPRIGVVYELSHGLSSYATVSRSFSPAAGDGLSTAATTAALSPLEATNREAGLKLDVNKAWSATAALFQLDRNITQTNAITNLTTTAGTQRSTGMDLGLNGRITKRLNLSASCEWLDARIVRGGRDSGGILLDGKQPALVPRSSVRAFATYDLGHGFGLGGGAVYFSDRYTSNDDSVRLPGFTVANAVAYYRCGHWETRLNVGNLFDRRYILTAGEGTDITGQTVMPGAPRNATVTLTWHY